MAKILKVNSVGRFYCLLQFIPVLLIALLLRNDLSAKVLKVEVSSRESVLDGKIFGEYGAYELIKGYVLFGFDPANPMNAKIVDLSFAPRNSEGLVEARSNFVVLKPLGENKGNNTALVEVSNRGGKFSLSYFNRAEQTTLNASNPNDFGDGLLMRMGLTVVWLGWQLDVPEGNDALRIEVPVVYNLDGSPIHGLVRCDWTIDKATSVLEISHRGHIPYPVADFDHPDNILTLRDGRESQRIVIPKDKWKFAKEMDGKIISDSNHIYVESGFEEGKIYELVYKAKKPKVVGLGLAAIRDIISYIKYDEKSIFPAKYGVAAGVSQTGRFLRHYLYQGFNTDEEGRKAYDGLMIITAGAGRGSFNHRFGQPSRDGHRYSAFFYPTDIFPFTSKSQFDTKLWRTDGIFDHMNNSSHIPKVFNINTGYEYWGRSASLIHISIDGKKDIDPIPTERTYHIASGQHYVGTFPPTESSDMGIPNIYRGNHLEFKVNYRALLNRLVEWVAQDMEPPDNSYPRIDNGTLVDIKKLKYPDIPGLEIPKNTHVAYRADYGPRWEQGIIDIQPPILGEKYPALVSQVDEYGNEMGGIRNVEISVPLATYMPWNIRLDYKGGKDELKDFLGSYIPFSRNDKEKTKASDTRPSISSLYSSKDKYLDKVTSEAEKLIEKGFLLHEDKSYIIDRAGTYWDWIMNKQ